MSKPSCGYLGKLCDDCINMEPLSQQDIESELSYAYLHAVVSRAGMSCQVTNRHQDNRGIDATITAWPSPEIGGNAEVDFKVQLKATIQDRVSSSGRTLNK